VTVLRIDSHPRYRGAVALRKHEHDGSPCDTCGTTIAKRARCWIGKRDGSFVLFCDAGCAAAAIAYGWLS